MKFDSEHIKIELLEKYFSGKLSTDEMNKLEKQALTDPFLYQAMEGYEEFPEAIDSLKKQVKNQKNANRSFFGSRTLALIGVLIVVYLTAVIINKFNSNSHSISENNLNQDSLVTKEVEIVRETIDTLFYAIKSEQNSPDEISSNQILIQEKQNAKIDSIGKTEQINVTETVNSNPDLEIIEENQFRNTNAAAPFIYINDLYVVDYREIDRKKRNVSYMRYELTGLSADFESEDRKSTTDLIEKEVEMPYMDYLKKSMKLFSKNDFKKSLNRYLTILEQYPEDLNALFYGAHCYYNLSQYELALNLFDQVLSIEQEQKFTAFIEEAEWYKSKTLIKLGRYQEAKTLLNLIIAKGQFYSGDAIKLVKNL